MRVNNYLCGVDGKEELFFYKNDAKTNVIAQIIN